MTPGVEEQGLIVHEHERFKKERITVHMYDGQIRVRGAGASSCADCGVPAPAMWRCAYDGPTSHSLVRGRGELHSWR